MSWLFSQALVEEYLGENFSDGEPFVQLSGNPTQQAYCALGKMTVFSRLSRFGMTYKPLTESRGEELLTLYREGFHAKILVQPEKEQELTESAAECGEKWRASFTKYDPDLRLWKTHQCSLVEDLEPFLETWPQWGLMRNGECWEQRTLEQTIRGTGYGLLQKTLSQYGANAHVVTNSGASNTTNIPLNATVFQLMNGTLTPTHLLMWPTPVKSDASGAGRVGPRKNGNISSLKDYLSKWHKLAYPPVNITEYMMGWPLGWTDLKPLEMDKSHSVQQPHGEFLEANNG